MGLPATDSAQVAVYGDVRRGQAVHARLVDQMLAEAPDAVVCTGDLVQVDEEADWAAFLAATETLRAATPYFPAVGNHDRQGIFNTSRFDALFPWGRYYSQDIGPARFFFVDTNQSVAPTSRQGQWLEAALQAAEGSGRWLIAVQHHPVYSTGPHGPHPPADRDLRPLYERYGVHLVLQGHDHLYERARQAGVTYIVTGGGGAPLYHAEEPAAPPTAVRKTVHHWILLNLTPERLEAVAQDLDGNVLDRFTLAPTDRGRPGMSASPPPAWGWWVLGLLLAAATAASLLSRTRHRRLAH
jgi:3',5'-cyclic AMP phosphodiesterase CpdA